MIHTRHPMEVRPGEVITVHPDTGQPCAIEVTDLPIAFHDCVEIEYFEDGRTHTLPVDQHTKLTVKTTPRRDVIDGLRDFAAFLEANPDVPVNRWITIAYSASTGRSDSDAVTEVNRVAGLVDAEPRRRGAHHIVTRDFGPVTYEAAAVGAYPEQGVA